MRPLTLLAGLLLVGLCFPMRSAEVEKGPLAPGKNVPDTFHPFNATEREKSAEELEEADKEALEKGGEKGGDKDKFKEEKYSSVNKFHCLITEYDLDPVVMLFARGLNDSEGFKEMLTKLDAACTKYRVRRLRAFVVFLDAELTNVVTDNDKRKERADVARKMAEELKLKNVVLTLGAAGDLTKYELGDSALTAVLYRALRIRATHVLNADELNKKDAAAIDVLMKGVEKHLVPK